MNAALRFLGKRVLWAIIVTFGVATIAFFVTRMLPGDPARMLLGPQARPADVARAREIYGLNQPLSSQYLLFFRRLIHRGPPPTASNKGQRELAHRSCAHLPGGLHLDLGFSFRYRRPVVEVLAQKAPKSMQLALAALLVQCFVGVGIGIFAARRRGRWSEQLAIGLTLVGVSLPVFLLGLLLQYLLAYKLGWLPYEGYGETAFERLRTLVLPALTIGLVGAAIYARLSRDELSKILGADYIRTARAKGASEMRVLVIHGLRNALVPLLTLLVLDLGTLVGGAVVTEKLFRWPGLGSLAVDALVNRDGPVVLGTVLFAAAAIVIATVALDVLYVVLDPRLRRAAHRVGR